MVSIGFAIALVAAGLAAGLSACGASIGCGLAGEMAAGVLSEDPDKIGSMLVLQALPGTQAFYGLVTAVLVLVRLNVFQAEAALVGISVEQGLSVLGACLPVIFGEFVSAIWQGRVSVGAMGTVAKRPDAFGKAVILPALVETFALLSLIGSILILLLGVKL
jgi:V/A-type H+/Na+-transporting ATPase subunit K